jgi:Kef-type K+ transport system membrane component KefB
MIRAVFLLGICVLLMSAARSFLPNTETTLVGSGAALAFGFALLSALQSGTIFSGLRLPKLTGYLVFGVLAGPTVSDFLTERMVGDLKTINNVAIGLIALSAGSELNFKVLKPRLRAISAICLCSVTLAMVLLTLAIFAFSVFLPFMKEMSLRDRLVISLVMGVVLSALSPTVTLALTSELGTQGPITETILGVVIVADLAIVFGFASVNALAHSLLGGGGPAEAPGWSAVTVHIFGSILVGIGLGIVLFVYIKRVKVRIALFVFGVCFAVAEAGAKLNLDPLLICLTSGMFIENLTDIGGAELVKGMESAAMPVFAVFFAVAGAGLHMDIFVKVAPVAIVLALVRAGSLYFGSRVGMKIGNVPEDQRKILHYGMYSQSGVAIGLSTLVARSFPVWGVGASACLFGAVMLNELVGPVLFRSALLRSGEAGKKPVAEFSH